MPPDFARSHLGVETVSAFIVVAFISWLMAMKLTESTAKIANLIFISPFLSLVLIHFIVGEKIMISSVIGLIFIIAGLLIQAATGKKKMEGSG